MSENVKEILQRMAETTHIGGAFSSDVLIAISEVLPETIHHSLETGCGKSTVMFSNISDDHYVFAYDDRNVPGSSVDMVQNDDGYKAQTTQWVYGPTQKTLPGHEFPSGIEFDVILLDGPHGYPFPDFEYALLYEKLKVGGLLIVDDVHIPSIGRMFDILREDRMYDEVGVFATTGILQRTSLMAVPFTGDHWFEQNYNVARFPLPMAKYHPARPIQFGENLNLSDANYLQRHGVKAMEMTSDGDGAKTIDMGATLAFDLPETSSDQLFISLTYKSIHDDGASLGTVHVGGVSLPLAFTKQFKTATIEIATPSKKSLKISIDHLNAIPEHDREIDRYNFRRLGTVIQAIRIDDDRSVGKTITPPTRVREPVPAIDVPSPFEVKKPTGFKKLFRKPIRSIEKRIKRLVRGNAAIK